MNDFIFLNLILTSAQGEYINLFPAKQQKIGLNNFFYTVKNLDSPGCPCEAPWKTSYQMLLDFSTWADLRHKTLWQGGRESWEIS